MVSTTLAGFLYISQLAVKQSLKQKSGSIVNVSTTFVDQPSAGAPAAVQIMVKGSLNAVARALAMEYAKDGIRVNTVALGTIKTPMHKPETYELLNGLHPVGRMGEIKEVVDAIAYAILLHVYLAQSANLTAHRNASLAALNESALAINNGVAWGQTVADAIWNLRLADGNAPSPPPFLGANVVGVWRPTPLLNASGAAPQYASMTPWVLTRPSQFRLPAPPALDSEAFKTDISEVDTMGIFSGSGRSSDQSELALFWAGNTPLYWNRIAAQISAERGLSLPENARLFALLNVSMADAGIACWDGKYRYVFWRPITAIRTGSAGIGPDPTWVPWLDFFPTGTPAHPEYPSGHLTVSGARLLSLPTRSAKTPRSALHLT